MFRIRIDWWQCNGRVRIYGYFAVYGQDVEQLIMATAFRLKVLAGSLAAGISSYFGWRHYISLVSICPSHNNPLSLVKGPHLHFPAVIDLWRCPFTNIRSGAVLCCLCGRGKPKSGQESAGNSNKVSVMHSAKLYVIELVVLPYYRDEQLAALQSGKEYDVLVIGGGVTGCGVALDSTLRGQRECFLSYSIPTGTLCICSARMGWVVLNYICIALKSSVKFCAHTKHMDNIFSIIPPPPPQPHLQAPCRGERAEYTLFAHAPLL